MRRALPLIIRLPLVMIGTFCLAGLAVLLTYFAATTRSTGKLRVNGELRSYIVHVPAHLDRSKPVALVISLHGFAGWPGHLERTSGWDLLADEEGFIVVYPRGTGFPLHWRATSPQKVENDVAFISALIDNFESRYSIDPGRIYADGFSNGGGMAYALACELSDRVAAIGTVSGAYVYPPADCHPTRPLPLIAFHGTDDPIVPFTGGTTNRFDLPFPNIADWMKNYAIQNGCSIPPKTLPAIGNASAVSYTGCNQNAEVLFYTLQNGGHTWPGAKPSLRSVVGQTNQDIQATDLMWQFFKAHPMP